MVWHNTRPRTRHQRAPAAFIDPCLPTKVNKPPSGDGWAHEIKHDGYRLQIHVDRGDVRLFTMTGYDWTDRYPGIVAVATKLRGSAILDAEAVVLSADGVADFEALHSRSRNAAAVAYGFDAMMLDGRDLRPLPWLERRAKLKRLLGRRQLGLIYNSHVVGGGPLVYRHACDLGLEGIVSKRIDAPYRSGKDKTWLKVKNPNAPGMLRFKE
jgi:bifunctional non-homologous end joining protein LigD